MPIFLLGPISTEILENQEHYAESNASSPTKDSVLNSPRKSLEKICTVETVNDLVNAQMLLKSNEDIQIGKTNV